MSCAFQVSTIQSGSEAQLNGELTRDFTTSCRGELLALLLNQRQQQLLDDDTLLALLVSTDEEIVLLALESLAWRSRWHHLVHGEKASIMFRELSRGWPPLDLLSCISGESSQLTMLELGNVSQDSSCLGLFNRLVRQLDVQVESRFGLLTRIRFARAFGCTGARHAYVKVMILAMQLQSERRLMPRQLRKVVKTGSGNVQIPGSIRSVALETLMVYYGPSKVFSPGDRQRRVEDFLSGRNLDSFDSGFVEAMLRGTSVTIRGHRSHRHLPAFILASASTDNVLTWLEKELLLEMPDADAGDERIAVVERLLLSRHLLHLHSQRHRDRLRACLLNLFRTSALFGPGVFNLAASLLTSLPGESVDAFMEAMLSVAIPSGWQVTEENAVACFFSHLTPELEKRTIRLVLNNVDMLSQSASFLLTHTGFTCSLLHAGGYDLIRHLPFSLLRDDQIWIADHVREEIGRRLCRDVDQWSGEAEKLLEHLDGMMRLGGVACIRQLRGEGMRNVVAVFQALAWPLTAVCFSVLELLLVKSSGEFEEEDMNILVESVLAAHGARFFLNLAAAENFNLMLAAWRHAGSGQRRRVVDELLPRQPEGVASAAAVFTRLFSSGQDQDVRLVPRVGSKVLEMLWLLEPPATSSFWPTSWLRGLSRQPPRSEYSGAVVTDLLRILIHMLELVHCDGDNVFAYDERSSSSSSRVLRLEALAWYRGSLAQASGTSHKKKTVEVVRLGEVLTRDYEVARELLGTWKLPHLVDKLLEVGAGDPCARSYATQTLVHLLEDERVLYRSMAYKMWDFRVTSEDSSLNHFLRNMSSLAWRDPAVFLQACSDTCRFNWDKGMVGTTLGRDQAHRIRRLAADKSSSSAPLFHHLLAHLLARLDDDALELLTTMLVELPVFVPATIESGALERVLQSSFASELVFSSFMDLLERHVKTDDVTRAMLNVFSSPTLDNSRLINACKHMQRCWDCVSSAVLERALSSLKLLELDHPEAEAAAASVFAMMIRNFHRRGDRPHPPQAFPGPELSDASVKAFRSRIQQMPLGCSASSFMAEAMLQREEVEEYEEWGPWEWSATDEQLETLGQFLWLAPRTGLGRSSAAAAPARLAELLLDDDEVYLSRASLSKVFLRMLQSPPGPCQRARGFHMLINGVPVFVLARVFHFLWKLVKRRFGMGYRFEEGTAVGFIPLLASATKVKELRRLSTKLLEAIVLQLQQHNGKTYSISLSGEELENLCHIAVHTSDRLSNALVSLVSLDPAFSSPFLLCMEELSSQVISSALDKLKREDYSGCGAVARVTQMFEGVRDAGARKQLAGDLAPLWGFIHLHRGKPGRGRRLIQALFIAEALTSETTPSERALELLRTIASSNHARLVKLALPMLQRWPELESVGFATKLECLRSSFATCPAQGEVNVGVRREDILRDSYHELHWVQPELLSFSGNTFVYFLGEPGYDAGGLRRELYQLLSRAIGKELFTEAGNPCTGSPLGISYFRFAGRLVAKAIVDDQRLDVRFSRSLYKHLLGQEVTYLDIQDAEYLRNLTWLLQNHVDESLGLTFSVDVAQSPPAQTTAGHDLVAGGSDIPVTDANKHEFVKLVGDYLLTESFRPELDAFLDGFHELVPIKLISSFLPAELELIVCGLQEINVSELKAVAKCKHEQQILEWFWGTVAAFDHHHKSLLLAFVTGSSKVPFGGVKKFLVGHMEGGDDYLPTARTCFSEILLPLYTTKENLEQKLVLAIDHGRDTFQFA